MNKELPNWKELYVFRWVENVGINHVDGRFNQCNHWQPPINFVIIILNEIRKTVNLKAKSILR